MRETTASFKTNQVGLNSEPALRILRDHFECRGADIPVNARENIQPPSQLFPRPRSATLNSDFRSDMKLENFVYIDRTGAWAVVAFTLVAGAMVLDTAHCLAEKSAHRHAPAPPVSQPAGTPDSEKLKKPVPIPNPREIGGAQQPGGDAIFVDKLLHSDVGPFFQFAPKPVVFTKSHRLPPAGSIYSPCQFASGF